MKPKVIAVLVCATIALASAASAASFTVNTTDDAVDAAPGNGTCATATQVCSLRAAIQEANALAGADTITLPRTLIALLLTGRNEDAAATGDLDITDDLTITGAGANATAVNGSHIDRVFEVHPGASVSITGIKIKGGQPGSQQTGYFEAPQGGGMLNRGTVTLTGVVFSANRTGINGSGGNGGGLENLGTATLTHVTFSHNAASNATTLPFEFNDAASGGGMENVGTATLSDVKFTANRAGDGSTVRESSHEGGWGGGMVNIGVATLTDVVFSNNRTGKGGFDGSGGAGGGLHNDYQGEITVTRATFVKNRTGAGGSNREEDGGSGGNGGGFQNDGVATLTDVTFLQNRSGRGGKPFGCSGSGAGLHNGGSVTLANATFDRNIAGASYDCEYGGSGGAMANDGEAILTNVSMTRNRAGKGISAYSYYPPQGGSGGALYDGDGLSKLFNVTLALNSVGKGADVTEDNLTAGEREIANTVIFGPNESCLGVIAGHNLYSGPHCTLPPVLQALKNNGGYTRTMALIPGSPAIDAGDDLLCPVSDQRGGARPAGAACDIGAYEVGAVFQSPAPTRTPTETPTITQTPTTTGSPTLTSTPTQTFTNTPTITPGGPTLTPTNSPTSTPTCAAAYRAAVMGNLPVAYWRLGETPGASTAIDETGHHNASYLNNPSLGIPGALVGDGDTAVNLNQPNDRVQAADVAALRLTNSFAIELWIKTNSTNGQGNRYVLSRGNRYSVLYEYVEDQLQFFHGYPQNQPCDPGFPTSTSNIPLTDTGWHHIVYSFETATNTWAGYKDGQTVFSVNCDFTLDTGADEVIIGAAAGGIANADVQVDEVALYNHALTAADVQKHYHAAACM